MIGASLVVVGVTVHWVGTHWIEVVLPPAVTGAIVALIGLNLAPAAKTNFEKGPLVGIVTLDDIAVRTGNLEVAQRMTQEVIEGALPGFFFHERG